MYSVATLAKCFELFRFPPLYCEDGLFLTHFYDDPTSSPLAWFYNGYVAVGPNLLGFVAAHLPVRAAPYFLSGTALAAGGLAYAQFTLPRFRAVVPSDESRFALAAMLVLWPLGDFAVLHAGVYSIWHLLMALVLLAIAPVGKAGIAWAALFAVQVLAVCSHPLAIILVPVWAASAFFWDRSPFARANRVALILLAIVFYAFAERHRSLHPFSSGVLGRTSYLLCVRVFLEALLGPALVVKLHSGGFDTVVMVLGAVAFSLVTAGVVAFRRRLDGAQRRFFWLTLYSVVAMMWVSTATRPLPPRPDLWAGRYYYLPQYFFLLACMVLVERVAATARWSPRRVAAIVAPALAWSAVLLYLDRYAFWEQVPTDGRQVGRFLSRVSEAERGEGSDEKLLFRRGKWSLEFRVRRAQ